MGTWTRLIVACCLALVPASFASARIAAIRTAAPLASPSDSAIEAAFSEAIEAALRGALAMGLPRVAVSRAVVLRDAVLVEILATDAETSHEADETPSVSASRPDTGSGRAGGAAW